MSDDNSFTHVAVTVEGNTCIFPLGEPTLGHLVNQLQTVFPQFAETKIQFAYRDEDGDTVTVGCQDDFEELFRFSFVPELTATAICGADEDGEDGEDGGAAEDSDPDADSDSPVPPPLFSRGETGADVWQAVVAEIPDIARALSAAGVERPIDVLAVLSSQAGLLQTVVAHTDNIISRLDVVPIEKALSWLRKTVTRLGIGRGCPVMSTPANPPPAPAPLIPMTPEGLELAARVAAEARAAADAAVAAAAEASQAANAAIKAANRAQAIVDAFSAKKEEETVAVRHVPLISKLVVTAAAEAKVEVDADAEVEVDADADAEVEVETDAKAETEAEVEVETDAEAETEAEAEVVEEGGAGADPAHEAQVALLVQMGFAEELVRPLLEDHTTEECIHALLGGN